MFVVREGGVASGCGGIQLFGTEYGELKRTYVERPRVPLRARALGKLMLEHLAAHALRSGGSRPAAAGTRRSPRNKEAIGLYEGFGFERICPFGEYKEDPLSIFST